MLKPEAKLKTYKRKTEMQREKENENNNTGLWASGSGLL